MRELTLRNNLILLKGPALRIDAESRVHTGTEIGPPSDLIVLSPGYGSVVDIIAFSRKVLSMKPNGRLRIVGTGLTAVDLILLTDNLRPDLEITCVSVTGRLPCVRSDFPVGGESLLKRNKHLANNPTLRGLVRELENTCTNRFERDLLFGASISFGDEISYVQENEPGWQAALYNSTPDYASFFARLSASERKFLFRIRKHFIERRVMFPLVNARKLKEMIGCGRLHLSASQLRSSEMMDRDTVPAFNSASTLTSFIRASQLPRHKYAGIQCSLSGRVRDPRLVYALGPITNGVRYFTEASSLTVQHAKLAVEAGFSRVLERRPAGPDLALFCGI